MVHKDQLSEASQKILELERAKQRIEEQIEAWVKIRDGFKALSETIDSLVPTKIGPTEAIRVILGKYPEGLTPTQIREELAGYGISCGSDKNFLGNIHTIIKRSKDIEQVGVGGRKLYKLRDFRPALGYPNPTNTQKKV
jgi:hypothetical protein